MSNEAELKRRVDLSIQYGLKTSWDAEGERFANFVSTKISEARN